MAEEPADKLTKEDLDLFTGEGGFSMSRIALMKGEAERRRAEAPPPAAAPQGPDFLDRVKGAWNSWWSKPEPAKPASASTAAPERIANPAIQHSMMPNDPDKASPIALAVHSNAHAPEPPAIAAGMNRAQITQNFRSWLDKTDTLPRDYAEKFLNDKDGSFRTKIENMFNRQEDPDAVSYGREFLKAMDTIKEKWDAAPRMDQASPDVRLATDMTPKP